MKTVKKTIFATLVVAMMGILITKVLPSATVNDLSDQNVEALALEDPEYPSNFGDGFGVGGYIIYEFDVWEQSYWVNTWSPGDGPLLHTTTCKNKYGTGKPTGQCKLHVIIIVG